MVARGTNGEWRFRVSSLARNACLPSLAVTERISVDLPPRSGQRHYAAQKEIQEDCPKHTSQFSYCSATSIAQSPAPRPHSRIFLGFRIGGNINLLSKTLRKTECMAPSRSISSCEMQTLLSSSHPCSVQHAMPTSSMGQKYTPLSRQYFWYSRPW